MFTPVVEYAAVDVCLKVIKRKQHLFIQSTDNVGSLFTLPVVAIDTRLTNRRVTMRANGFSLKAARVYIYNGVALLLKVLKLILIRRSFDRTGFWMF